MRICTASLFALSIINCIYIYACGTYLMFYETGMVFISVRFNSRCRMELLLFWIFLCVTLLYPVKAVKEEDIIRCFDCSFDMRNENCDDRFSTIGISVTNCTGSCVKVKMYKDGENKVFGRYCSPKREIEQCRVTDTGGGQRMEDCYCNSDLCNDASQNKLNGFLVHFLLVIGSFYGIF